jgi:hypothetical protein
MAENAPESEHELFNRIPSELSDREANLLMEQYKLYVETADRASDRRNQVHSYFITVNTALIVALSGLMSLIQNPALRAGCVAIAAAAGILLCFTWRRLILSYRELNAAKFQMIHLLELRFPAQPFHAEWAALRSRGRTAYKPHFLTEVALPIVFVFLYVLLAAVLIVEAVF